MKVITNRPILKSTDEYMSGPDGQVTGVLAPATPSLLNPASATTIDAPKIGKTRAEKVQEGLDKARNVYQKGQESGIFQSIGNLLGFGKKTETAPVAVVTKEEPKKEDNTMKYVLIGGGVLALGLVVYFATKSSGKSGK